MAVNLTIGSVSSFLNNPDISVRSELYDNREKGLYVIKLAKGGSWRYRFNFNGKRYRHTIGSTQEIKPEQARELASQWRNQIKNEGINPIAEIQQNAEQQSQQIQNRRLAKVGVFFEEIYTPHLLRMSNRGQDTLNIIKVNFEHLFNRYMDQLTTADLRAWENKRKQEGSYSKTEQGKPISRATLVRALNAFRAMINYAADKKKKDPNDNPVIEFNPISEFSLSLESAKEKEAAKLAKEELKIKRDLLGEEERQLIQHGLMLLDEQARAKRKNSRRNTKSTLADLDTVAYGHWFVPFAHIARLTGMRAGDIRRLRWSDLQQDFRTRMQVLKYTPNKTAHHKNPLEVTFPVSGELQEVLKLWREQNGNPKAGLIFPSKITGKEMGKSVYHEHWAKVKQLAGVREDIDFYCFRHNFISDMVNMNFPLLAIARLVGHKSTAMIEEHYYKEDLTSVAGMAAALEATHITRQHKKVVTLD